MKLDLLVIAAHPDDAEIGCGGTILSHVGQGKNAGIIDLTRGELGTRGSAELRDREAADAAKVLGLSVRENMEFRDGFFQNDEPHQLELIKKIRQYRPEFVLTNAPHDRHPDHGKASRLVKDACFFSGLRKLTTQVDGKEQEPWRPHNVFCFIQYYHLKPDFVVDIEPYFEKKLESLKCYRSQFHDPSSSEPETILTSESFMDALTARWREMGSGAHIPMAEGFISDRTMAVKSLFDLHHGGMP